MEKNIYWLNADSRKFLSSGYLMDGETAEQRISDVAQTAESLLSVSEDCIAKVNAYLKCKSFAEKFADYVERGFYSLSSPNWSNLGRKRGLPISCFGTYLEDSIESITGHKLAEISMMTKSGGGTSAFFGNVRPRGSKISSGGESTGSVHFMELYDKMMTVVSQGNTRRGACATYLPIDHGDIEEFLKIKSEGNDIQELSIGVCVSNQWMQDMIDGNKENRRIWGLVIQKRFESGYPYIFFSDNANDQAPQVYKDKNLKISHSNLCNEIMLADSPTESFVCNLSSLNLDKWEEWKDTDAVETMVFFLDAVMTEFIYKTEKINEPDNLKSLLNKKLNNFELSIYKNTLRFYLCQIIENRKNKKKKPPHIF
jgi:ribonucleoside-diphosphate reductase alpha chain